MSSVFLSYARDDDEPFVRRLYDDLVKTKFDVWFDRVKMPSRGLTFHQEIREAITDRDRLLLVVGPQAVKSEYVRQEWQYAWFDAEKVVTPILRLGDYPLPIPELALLHCEDFRNDAAYQTHLKELIRILQEPAPPMGQIIGAPALPAHFLTRTDRLISLRDALRSGLDSPAPLGGTATHHQFHGIASVSRQVGLHGMGGIGKSVLANLLARDREVRKAFPDGIVWIGLGSSPNITSLMQRVHQQLGGDGLFTSEHEGQQKLKELLINKAVLLVIDDVWRRQDVDALNVLGARCRALITTRDAGLLTSIGGTHHLLQLLTDDEALRLLAVAVGLAPADLPIDARDMLAECGRLPLAIALAGGMAKSGISWSDIRDALREHDLEYISDESRSEAQHQSLWRMIEVSVNALTAEEQLRLVELVVFPPDAAIPEAPITTLWESTAKLSPRYARKLLTKLKQRSLIQTVEMNGTNSGQPVDGQFFFHDLIHDYGLARYSKTNGDLKALHSQLLSAYQSKAPHGWWSGPNDGYFFQQLGYHLVAAGRTLEFVALLQNLDWLDAKIRNGFVVDLNRDLQDIVPIAKTLNVSTQTADRVLLLQAFVARNTHKFQAVPTAVFPVAAVEAAFNPSLQQIVNESGRALGSDGKPWLQVLERPHRSIESACVRTFVLENIIDAVAIWDDSGRDARKRIIFAAAGREIHRFDISTGSELSPPLSGHHASVKTLGVRQDGTVVSTLNNGSLQFWDGVTGSASPNTVLPNSEHFLATSADGMTAVSRSSTSGLAVWNTVTGEQKCLLQGSELILSESSDGILWLSADGTRIAMGWMEAFLGGFDWILHIWNGNTGAHQFPSDDSDGAANPLNDPLLRLERIAGERIFDGIVSVGKEDTQIVFGPKSFIGQDNAIRVWDGKTGAIVHTLRGHTRPISALAQSRDGALLLSGSTDDSVRVWDLTARSIAADEAGHKSKVTHLETAAGGAIVASAASDGIRLWAPASGKILREFGVTVDDDQSLAISSDGLKLAVITQGHKLRVYPLPMGPLLVDFEFDNRRSSPAPMSIGINADGSEIVSSLGDSQVRVWKPETENVIRYLDRVYDPFITSRDAAFLLHKTSSGAVEIMNWQTGHITGALKLADDDKHSFYFPFAKLSSDGSTVACVNSSTDTIDIWSVVSGQKTHVLSGHCDSIAAIDITTDGSIVVSGSHDRTLRVWNAITATCCLVFPFDVEITAVAITNDNAIGRRLIVVGLGNGDVLFFHLMNLE